MISPQLLEIEKSVNNLSINEKLWLLEQIARKIREGDSTDESTALIPHITLEDKLNQMKEFLGTPWEGKEDFLQIMEEIDQERHCYLGRELEL
ncbi:hypothetical protein PL8927_220035 [Planktothrix serta PCC 8927]|uniref:Uncharacterized protein n=1 Tax=Planktothrix serta PCC 8927 TaxID=671068 RepID=A0A7Z9BGQ6_9CYAN|nr:hypothetical protein [Planktothrix serta]VXD13033.1 hypothetical protein PL8927_220035 [Planktothrix serta PCC 8927]